MNYVIHTTFDRMIIQILCKLVKIPWRPVQSHSNPIKIPWNPMKSSFLSNEVPLNPIKIPWNPTKSHEFSLKKPQRIQKKSPLLGFCRKPTRHESAKQAFDQDIVAAEAAMQRFLCQETCQGGACPSDKCVIIPWKL